jgi:Rv0078B-related antitoxin
VLKNYSFVIPRAGFARGICFLLAFWVKQLQSVPVMKTEAQRVLQAMSPAQKLRAAERLYLSARQLKAAALRAEHPDWTDEAIHEAVRQIFLYARS